MAFTTHCWNDLQSYTEGTEIKLIKFNKKNNNKIRAYLAKSEDLSIICSNSAKERAPSSSKSASSKIF